MKTKILVIFVVCLGLLALMPNGNSESGVMEYKYDNLGFVTSEISNISDAPKIPYLTALVTNISAHQYRWIVPWHYFDVNLSEVYKMEIILKADNVYVAGNVSIHALTGGKSGFHYPPSANWTYTGNTHDWTSAGGDFNSTPLDTQYVETAIVPYYTWNVTTYLQISKDVQHGFIFIAEEGCNVSLNVVTSTIGFRIKLYYKEGSGESTDIYKDIWNLKGFAGVTHKLASTIFSEISYCTALSWKNATSGYWYTYWPAVGLTEDEYLEFGDGLFILTSDDTTWNHA